MYFAWNVALRPASSEPTSWRASPRNGTNVVGAVLSFFGSSSRTLADEDAGDGAYGDRRDNHEDLAH